ncbi:MULTISPECIES: hypothetical protein [unclassified Methanoculleus]|uniref:hypothetical protein n=1 Tax=unclassified Methanoculleus TaxID=2619537 RepID=UPI0025F17F9A|nr:MULTISPECIES: hypothetical protein [unclassified Methanoculleus]MCK9318559.1 hypothetical protein [Methanoculleus sp.]MDD2253116.1 hypothetical protein [Methanoculleus sp.]MDD2787539.1 hypothetical protein [Methanoculleus sp.]MDD3216953.1 hypothetical protein [Methanoculleus sp.]MDD4313320.1 hypothetical protein [Methanoculleus sp.]
MRISKRAPFSRNAYLPEGKIADGEKYDYPAVQIPYKRCIREKVDDVVQVSFGCGKCLFYALLVGRESGDDGCYKYEEN